MSSPESFLPDIAYTLEPAETGRHGCLEPQLDDPGEDTEGDVGDDE
jgi:hypothetical protein